MSDYTKIDQYIHQNLDASLQELNVLLAQPSVSAQNWGIKECAEMVAGMLRKRGFTVEVMPTGGAPVVFAERKGKTDQTLLFYNHYDVQPPEPLELWHTPPFTPTIKDGNLYARGVSDNKGNIVSRLFAIDAILAADGELPCTIKFAIEGEEETSSVHLKDFVLSNSEKLSADACIWEFGGIDELGQPVISLGLRGICYVELSAETASQDVHSGLGGSIFPNAAWRLVWALNTLKGRDERIRIPNYYDDIRKPGAVDWELMEKLPDVAEDYKQRYGLKGFLKGIEGGVELRMAAVFEPTCTICGLTSGYQGPGSKTVLPAKASAKVDFRLVPDQDPEKVVQMLRAHLDREGFADVKVDYLGGEAPGRTDPEHPFVKLVAVAAESAYQRTPQINPMIGGSGPNHVFQETLKVPLVSAGVGYPGSGAHAPNEHIRIEDYLTGTKHVARILKMMGNQG
jgi:acetylornithine deacetylase/succinyl-diaminopimelate desuccinylase-like protein